MPASHRVPQPLTELDLTYIARQVPADRLARNELRSTTCATEIPVLVVDGKTLAGEQAILACLSEHFVEPPGADE